MIRLTDEIKAELMAAKGKMTSLQAAAEFNVSVRTVQLYWRAIEFSRLMRGQVGGGITTA